jgi:outer membrane receptor protein involved in Fe transport
MKKSVTYLCALVFANCLTIAAFSQSSIISGKIENQKSSESITAVSVTIKGEDGGTFSDDNGNFKVTVTQKLPVTLMISAVGYTTKELVVSNAAEHQVVTLEPNNSLGQEVVISASRVSQKMLESPVSIERISAQNIRNAPAANFYDVVSTLKGVDVTTSSLTFRTPTTRGFGGSGNVRFNQLVDGMDNQAPGLNFSVGAIVGLNALDVDNIELLPGASSALYGPGGMNGTMLMTSKSPFKYQGLSFEVKEGLMHTGSTASYSPSLYSNWSIRWAQKVSDKFAFKITTELLQAKDWIAADQRNYDVQNTEVIAGTRTTDPNYNGINVYGDETTADIRQVLFGIATQAPFLAPFINTLTTKPLFVSRTGYTEKEVIDPNNVNFKLGGSFNFKITPNVEAILAGYWGTGNTVYTAASRYSIKNFKMGQYKFELQGKNWMFRAYTTQENAGDTYSLGATTQVFNEVWKPSGGSTGWYAQYGQAYLNAMLGGASEQAANNAARAVADVGRPAAGTPEFDAIYNQVRTIPSPSGGLLLDRSDLYAAEGSYNLSSITHSFADIIIGANVKKYSLNSQGTLFADTAGPIGITEGGAFIQLSRSFGKLNLTASGRYDKNQNFAGRFTPRLTALFKVAENNNIRLSYQTAYRFPSNQTQWINLLLPSYFLIGGNKAFIDMYNFDNNPAFYQDSLANGKIVEFNFTTLKPESLSSFELGYKGLLMDSKLLIDAFGYIGQYTNFLARTRIIQKKAGIPELDKGQIYSVPVNSTSKIKTYGFGIGLSYSLPRNFAVNANLASDNLTEVPENLVASFNSPKYKTNISLSNSGFGPNNLFGFNVAYRWQDGFYYEGDVATGNVPEVQTLDLQFSYKIRKVKSIIKFGATNLLNQYYYNGLSNSYVGGLYYLSFGYNVY